MKDGSGLHNQLKAIRTRLQLSQQDLATAAGVARQTIGGIEAELYAPSAAVALRLAKALGCRVEEIFWLDDETATIDAVPVGVMRLDTPQRLTLAQIGGRWVAHPLQGASAFRSEMIPADGIGVLQSDGGSKPSKSRTVAVKLLDDSEALARTVVLAGCTPALSLWARSAERWFPGLRVHWIHANSTEALESLSRREVHAAGIHLCDPVTGECNAPFVKRVFPDQSVVLVNLGVWEEGLVVQSGNPKRLECASDLAQSGVLLVNREKGSGARLMLDTLLDREGVSIQQVQGYERELRSHHEIALAVSTGQADVGVTTAGIAATYGLGFVLLRSVRYDLALLKEYISQDPVRQLLSTLDHRWVRSQLSLLGGYDTASTGEMITFDAVR